MGHLPTPLGVISFVVGTFREYLDDMVFRAEHFGKMSGRYRYAEGWIRHHPAGFCADDFNPMLDALKDDAFVNPRFEASLQVEFPA